MNSQRDLAECLNYLKKLDSYHGEHELKEVCNQHNIANGPNGN